MPYKYVGRPTSFVGKTLWEIVGNLKNFGVGRIIVRSHNEKFPEPSYMKIMKVETVPTPLIVSSNDPRKVIVWVERTFRGRKFPDLVKVYGVSHVTDYKLIPKSKEVEYCTMKGNIHTKKVMPRTTTFPPLLKEIILRDMKSKGLPLDEEPRLSVVYRQSRESNYRVAEASETPTVEISCGLGIPASPILYKGIKL